MKNVHKLFLLLSFLPTLVMADAPNVENAAKAISSSSTISDADKNLQKAVNETIASNEYKDASSETKAAQQRQTEETIKNALSGTATSQASDNNSNTSSDTRTDEERAKDLQEKQDAYDAAKAKENSKENKMLTALSTAATGIGGMELAMGLSQQKADKEADKDMDAYIETFRCTYANGKSVKASSVEIELPGGNDQNMMNYRGEYLALAADLKERKAALGMAAGIESEEILDKATTGLYDEENVGITKGSYESLYRAKALESEKDQAMIDENAKSAKNRVIAGAVVGGVGVVGGMLGNSLINGKLGELIKEKKANQTATKENESAIASLKAGLKSTGMTDVDKLDFSTLDISGLKDHITNTDWTKIDAKGESATKLINTSNKTSFESSFKNLATEYTTQ